MNDSSPQIQETAASRAAEGLPYPTTVRAWRELSARLWRFGFKDAAMWAHGRAVEKELGIG